MRCRYKHHDLAGPGYTCPSCGEPQIIEDRRNVIAFEWYRAIREQRRKTNNVNASKAASVWSRFRDWIKWFVYN